MASRLDLRSKLRELLGNENTYYQPPSLVKMSYPAIVYSKDNIDIQYADDKAYLKKTRYTLIVIDTRPDNVVIDKLLELPYCSFDRHYPSDNLHHDVLNLYY